MPLDLTHYEKLYAIQKQCATKMAQDDIKIMEERTCCEGCVVTIEKKDITLPKGAFKDVCNMTQSMLYSSGYYGMYEIKTKNGKLSATVTITSMDAEQKAKLATNDMD